MKVAFGHKHVLVLMNKEEVDKFVEQLGEGWFTCDWNDKEHALTVRHATHADRTKAAPRRQTNVNSEVYALDWQRGSLPYGGKRMPTFGACHATYAYVGGKLTVLPPPQAERPEVRRKPGYFISRSKRRATTGSAPTAVPSGNNAAPADGPGKALDLLDALRHHRDKLNALRARHPDQLTFKVRADGTIGFEFLADE